MLAGLIAGSVAALVASLVSLPLRSPLDLAFNTLTITLASLVVGMVSGLLWKTLADNPRRPLYYAGGLAAAFVVVAVVALVGNMWLERFAAFTIPLAAIVFALSGILAPVVGGISGGAARGLAVVLLIASVGLGVGLASQGDTESGELSLPERAEAPTPTPTEPPSRETTPPATAGTTPKATAMAVVSTSAPTPTTPAEATAPAVTPAAPAGGTSQAIRGDGRVGDHLHRWRSVEPVPDADRGGVAHVKAFRPNQPRRSTVHRGGGAAFSEQRPAIPRSVRQTPDVSPASRGVIYGGQRDRTARRV